MVYSARGTIQNSRPRDFLPALLHIRLAVLVVELIMLLVKTLLAAQPGVISESSNCENLSVAVTVSRVVVAITWFIFFGVFASAIIYLDPCHVYSAKINFELVNDDSNDIEEEDLVSTNTNNETFSRSVHPVLRRRWKVTHTVWEKRIKLMCGCLAGQDEQHEVAYKELAVIFAYLFCDSNLVLSDIAAGLILVQKEHIEKELTLRREVNESRTRENSVPLNFSDPEERQIFKSAVHYLKFALGTYTWPIFMYMNPCGCFKLCTHAAICPCKQRTRKNIFQDNSCFCGYAGLLSVTELNEADIVYASFENDICRAPFVVLLDHDYKSVVVAIRGTISVQDIITDAIAFTQQIELPDQPNFRAHKGMYQTAFWIKQKLDSGILDEAFQKVPNYSMVIVGHSLGSGCACLLAMLLKNKYQDLKCYCYSPPGSLLNADAATATQSFVTSVTLGHDLVTRLTFYNAQKLKEEVIRVLRKCQKPKFRILLEGLLETFGNFCGHHILFKEDFHSASPTHDCDHSPLLVTDVEALQYESLISDAEGEQESSLSASAIPPSPKYYPPGRIIHLVDTMTTNGGCFSHRTLEARWVSSSSFQTIVVTPDMVKDHFPDVLMKAMNAIWDEKKDEITENRMDNMFVQSND